MKNFLLLIVLFIFTYGCNNVDYNKEYEKVENFYEHFYDSGLWVSIQKSDGIIIENNLCFEDSLAFLLSPRGDLSNYDELISMREDDCNKLYKEFNEIIFPDDLSYHKESFIFLTRLYLEILKRYDTEIKENTSILRSSSEFREFYKKRYFLNDELEEVLEFYGLNSFQELWQQEVFDYEFVSLLGIDFLDSVSKEEIKKISPEKLKLYTFDFHNEMRILKNQITMLHAIIWIRMLDLDTSPRGEYDIYYEDNISPY